MSAKNRSDIKKRNSNMIVIGQIGERVVQTKIITKEDFKKEYAPKNAIIKEIDVKGFPCVQITY